MANTNPRSMSYQERIKRAGDDLSLDAETLVSALNTLASKSACLSVHFPLIKQTREEAQVKKLIDFASICLSSALIILVPPNDAADFKARKDFTNTLRRHN